MNRSVLAMAAGAALLICGASPSMAVSNGSFESGFSGWNTAGSANIQGTYRGVAPTDGTSQAMLATNRTSSGSQGALGSAAEQGALNAFLGGVNFNALYPGRDTHDGSAVSQSFSVAGDSTLSFDWALGHQSGFGDSNDAAFVLIRDSLNNIVSFQTIARLASTALNIASTDGWKFSQTSSFTNLPTLGAGDYTIYVGVMNVNRDTGRSALLLDNFQLSSASGSGDVEDDNDNDAIPEPLTAGMTLLGLGALTYITRRRRDEKIA